MNPMSTMNTMESSLSSVCRSKGHPNVDPEEVNEETKRENVAMMKDALELFYEYKQLAAKYKKCVFCNKPSAQGNLCTIVRSESECEIPYRTFTVRCGHSPSCPTIFQFVLGDTFDVETIMYECREEMQKCKMNIILIKNDMLFGLIDNETAVAKFDECRQVLETLTSLYERSIQAYEALYDNIHKQDEIQAKKASVQQHIETIKQTLRRARDLGEVDRLFEEVRNLYVMNIVPTLEEIRKLQYPFALTHTRVYNNEAGDDEDDKEPYPVQTCTLLQSIATVLQTSQLQYSSTNRVISKVADFDKETRA